jgi:hypothetical protein
MCRGIQVKSRGLITPRQERNVRVGTGKARGLVLKSYEMNKGRVGMMPKRDKRMLAKCRLGSCGVLIIRWLDGSC